MHSPPTARDLQLSGRNFALGQDYCFAIGSENGVGLFTLPVEEEPGYLEASWLRLEAKILEVAFSPDGKWAAALEAGMSGPARIFILSRSGGDSYRSGLYGVCQMPDDSTGLAFSNDSKRLQASTYDPFTRDTFDVLSCRRVESKNLGAYLYREDPVISPNGKIRAERSKTEKRSSSHRGGGRGNCAQGPD